MATTSENAGANRVLVSNQITRVVLMDDAARQRIITQLRGSSVAYSALLTLKLLLPEQSANLIVPAGSYADDILSSMGANAVRAFTQGQMDRLYR